MVVNCKTFAEGKMAKQPTIGHYEYHQCFMLEKQNMMFILFKIEVPEFFDISIGMESI